MRLIDADELCEGRLGNDPVRIAVMCEPTIDAVQVVRCKDCRHWGMGISGETDRIKCCVYARYMVGENGYCVYGEKV